MPNISVVMPVRNGVEHVERAMLSVLDTARVDLELVVVDDASTDGTLETLEKIAQCDRRVRIIRQGINTGITQSLVMGCKAAVGEFIARQDADDITIGDRLTRQYDFLKMHQDVGAVGGAVAHIGPHDEFLYRRDYPRDTVQATEMVRRAELGPVHGSVMFRRSAYEAAGGYRSQFRYAQDWDLWLRLSESWKFAYLPEVVYKYRVHPSASAGYAGTQKRFFFEMAKNLSEVRREGGNESKRLQELSQQIPKAPTKFAQWRGKSAANLMIARWLQQNRDLRWRHYAGRGLATWPFSRVAAATIVGGFRTMLGRS